jgi:aminopeptidase
MSSMIEAYGFASQPALARAAEIAVSSVLELREGETLLIVANPRRDALEISSALFDAATVVGARASLLVQPVKAQTDFAEAAVIAAIDSNPDVFVSLSTQKLGKDREGILRPYEWDGQSYDHIFEYKLRGAKTLRAFWSPRATVEMFARTVPIDYAELRRRCRAVAEALEGALYARVTNAGGTDIRVGLAGRSPRSDDGDFAAPGSGGNLPAGEVFISPSLGSSEGLIVFDGSMAGVSGDILIREGIRCRVEGGYVVDVSGGEEAAALRASLDAGQAAARTGNLPQARVGDYVRNARNLGELGIGLNPAATVRGNMLEDEKAFRTCHFAIGSNYDEDAPALIHLDGLVSRPTIVVTKADGREIVIEREGELAL